MVPDRVKRAYGLEGAVVRLPGGTQPAYRVGAAVVKRIQADSLESPHSLALVPWLHGVLAEVEPRGFRLARPVRSRDGRWMLDDGWTACTFVRGRALRPTDDIPAAIAAVRALHAALAAVPMHPLLDRNTSPFGLAHRCCWDGAEDRERGQGDEAGRCNEAGRYNQAGRYSEAGRYNQASRCDEADRSDEADGCGEAGAGPGSGACPAVHPLIADQVAALRALYEPLPPLPRQLTHGDLNPANVLVAPGEPPGFLDFTPYWAPADFALATFANWIGPRQGTLAPLASFDDVPHFRQLLLREAVRMLLVVSNLDGTGPAETWVTEPEYRAAALVLVWAGG